MDPLSPLFARFSLAAKVFFSGALCGEVDFDHQPGMGHLHLLRQGSLRVTQEGSAPLEISQPSLFFYPRPCQHAFHVDDPPGAKLVCASIEFGASMGNPLLKALPELLLVPLADIRAIEPTMALLFGEAFADLPGRQAGIDRLAEYALILLLRHAVDARIVDGGLLAALADPRLSKALTAMHERPEHPWTLEELASVAGMSRARFAAHFRTTTGATPLDYLTDWRISVAQTLLKRGKPLKLVAPMVGYSNPVALARVFARRTKLSPSDWIARVTQTDSIAGEG